MRVAHGGNAWRLTWTCLSVALCSWVWERAAELKAPIRTIAALYDAVPRVLPAPVIVLEWVDGDTIEALVTGRGHDTAADPLARRLRWLLALAETLHFMHSECHVAHCDVTPLNVMVCVWCHCSLLTSALPLPLRHRARFRSGPSLWRCRRAKRVFGCVASVCQSV